MGPDQVQETMDIHVSPLSKSSLLFSFFFKENNSRLHFSLMSFRAGTTTPPPHPGLWTQAGCQPQEADRAFLHPRLPLFPGAV